MPVISLLYKTHRGGRPSTDPTAEAAWFLSHMVDANIKLLAYMPLSGQDGRTRSATRGCKHPAFALFVRQDKRQILLTVRGTQDKNDHLIDLDLADSRLSAEDPSGVHRGMLNSAKYILDEWGLRGLLLTTPADYGIRLVGHSLGAGICALVAALLKTDPVFKSRDVKVIGFGMPACAAPELAERLKVCVCVCLSVCIYTCE